MSRPCGWRTRSTRPRPTCARRCCPGLLEAAKRNLARGLVDLRVYEIGTVFLPDRTASIGSETLPPGAALPERRRARRAERGHPGPAAAPRRARASATPCVKQPGQAAVAAGLADALTMVRQTAAAVGVHGRAGAEPHQALHPGRTAQLIARAARRRPRAGRLRRRAAAGARRGARPAARRRGVRARPGRAHRPSRPPTSSPGTIAGFPAADAGPLAGRPRRGARRRGAARGPRGRRARCWRTSGSSTTTAAPGCRTAHKSLTFALRFRADDRTLTAAEASEAKLAGAAVAAELFGATIRE